jgi:hypothetical protein
MLLRGHDLRHKFAVNRVTTLVSAREDVQALLPALSTYLGHVDLSSTQRYLTMYILTARALHRVRSSDYQWRSSEKEAIASGFNDAAWLAERPLVRIYGLAPEVAER